jgi:hypothetical protein
LTNAGASEVAPLREPNWAIGIELRNTQSMKKPPADQLMKMKAECQALAGKLNEKVTERAEMSRVVSERANAQTRIWEAGAPHPEDLRQEFLELLGRTVSLQKEILNLTLARRAELDEIGATIKSTSQFRITARLERFTEYRDFMTNELEVEIPKSRQLREVFREAVDNLEQFVSRVSQPGDD